MAGAFSFFKRLLKFHNISSVNLLSYKFYHTIIFFTTVYDNFSQLCYKSIAIKDFNSYYLFINKLLKYYW